jgi:hypothetical protein
MLRNPTTASQAADWTSYHLTKEINRLIDMGYPKEHMDDLYNRRDIANAESHHLRELGQ